MLDHKHVEHAGVVVFVLIGLVTIDMRHYVESLNKFILLLVAIVGYQNFIARGAVFLLHFEHFLSLVEGANLT